MKLEFNSKFDLGEECMLKTFGGKVKVIVDSINCIAIQKRIVTDEQRYIRYNLHFTDTQLQYEYGGFHNVEEKRIEKLK